MEKSGAHRCALPAKFKPGNGDFQCTPPALHPPFLWRCRRGVSERITSYAFLRFFYCATERQDLPLFRRTLAGGLILVRVCAALLIWTKNTKQPQDNGNTQDG